MYIIYFTCIYLHLYSFIYCLVEDLNVPFQSASVAIGNRYDNGKDYFDWNIIKDFTHPQKKYIIVRTIIQAVFVPKSIPKGVAYNSKNSTGMVGLENLGATCYLNALLQVRV